MNQPRLLEVPILGLMPYDVGKANEILVAWGHRLGEIHRPFGMQAFVLEHQTEPISVAVSASIVSATVTEYRRGEVVECARLCSAPDATWATRVMLRLWREACAPLWPYWPVKAAISYSQNAWHDGGIYRHDGWERIKEDCGSSGGGAWSRKRYATDAVYGKKTLWIWRYNR